MATGGQPWRIAGVKGGVGTSTLCALVRQQYGPEYDPTIVEDLGVYHAGTGQVHLLVVANDAAATGDALSEALRHHKPAPVVVVMHTTPGDLPSTAAVHLRAKESLVGGREFVHIGHQPHWRNKAQASDRSLNVRQRHGRSAMAALESLPRRVASNHRNYRPPALPSQPDATAARIRDHWMGTIPLEEVTATRSPAAAASTVRSQARSSPARSSAALPDVGAALPRPWPGASSTPSPAGRGRR